MPYSFTAHAGMKELYTHGYNHALVTCIPELNYFSLQSIEDISFRYEYDAIEYNKLEIIHQYGEEYDLCDDLIFHPTVQAKRRHGLYMAISEAEGSWEEAYIMQSHNCMLASGELEVKMIVTKHKNYQRIFDKKTYGIRTSLSYKGVQVVEDITVGVQGYVPEISQIKLSGNSLHLFNGKGDQASPLAPKFYTKIDLSEIDNIDFQENYALAGKICNHDNYSTMIKLPVNDAVLQNMHHICWSGNAKLEHRYYPELTSE